MGLELLVQKAKRAKTTYIPSGEVGIKQFGSGTIMMIRPDLDP